MKIPQYSPWFRSTWERLIRVIKTCLYKKLGKVRVDYFHLLILLSGIRRAVNSIPLTYRCSTDDDIIPLTPDCFIQPNVNCELSFQADAPNAIEFGSQGKYVEQIQDSIVRGAFAWSQRKLYGFA